MNHILFFSAAILLSLAILAIFCSSILGTLTKHIAIEKPKKPATGKTPNTIKATKLAIE